MYGFKDTTFSIENREDRLGYVVPKKVNPKKENERMMNAGFEIDEENSVYTKEGYGAYIRNIVNPEVKSIEDLRNHENYAEVVKMIEQGYEIVIGPGAPENSGVTYGKGLYCRNYKQILEKQKTEGQKRAKKENEEQER